MEMKDVYQLWDRFDSSDIAELELDMQGTHIKLRKAEGSVACGVTPVAATPKAVVVNTTDNNSNNENVTEGTPVKAPLVGTFYKAPTPNDEPFVKVGQKIKKGDVIGIIEAMKLMNEVVAPCDGEVVEIKVEDSTMVQYDQVLMVLN